MKSSRAYDLVTEIANGRMPSLALAQKVRDEHEYLLEACQELVACLDNPDVYDPPRDRMPRWILTMVDEWLVPAIEATEK